MIDLSPVAESQEIYDYEQEAVATSPSPKGYSLVDSISSYSEIKYPWLMNGFGGLLVGTILFSIRKRLFRTEQNGKETQAQIVEESPPPPQLPDKPTKLSLPESVIKKEPPPQSTIIDPAPKIVSYKQFPSKLEDLATIKEIITTTANSTLPGLGFKQYYLKEISKKIEYIHSLKFISIIFLDLNLKSSMVKISKCSPKWNGFLYNFKEKGMLRYTPEELDPFLDEWAKDLKTTKAKIQPLINNPFTNGQDWGPLLIHLMSV